MATQNNNTEAAAIAAARASLNKKASREAAPAVSVDQVRAAALSFVKSFGNDKKASQQQPLGLKLMNKIASRDLGGLRVLCALDGLNKIAEAGAKGDGKPFVSQDTKDAFKNLWESIKGGVGDAGNWIADKSREGFNGAAQWLADPTHLKQLGVGLGTGGAAYGLSWLLPGARHTHGLRLLASLLAGAGAGYYGDNIVNAIAGNGFNSDAEKAALDDDVAHAEAVLKGKANTGIDVDANGNQVKGASDKSAVLKGILAKHLAK